jgi:hypothetical protein
MEVSTVAFYRVGSPGIIKTRRMHMRKATPAQFWSKQNLIGLLFVVIGSLLVVLVVAALILPVSVWADGGNRSFIPLILAGGSSNPATPTPSETMVTPVPTSGTPAPTPPAASNSYIVIGWNDLGMHCYDLEYSTMSVLPPFNNIWAQVILRGDPPQIVTQGIQVEYSFPDNTYSVGKTNFWDYAEKLWGVNLAPNVGLLGKGLAGTLDASGDHFVAEGVPVTEFSDSDPTKPDYFQMAHLVAKDESTGKVLAQTDIVVPVSSEMRCDTCHNRPTSNFRMNILLKHDDEEGTNLASQAQSGNPVMCAKCHNDPILNPYGIVGNPNLPSFSAAMHGKHREETSNCYACHPGPTTQCLRGVMATQYDFTCTNCHVGGMQAMASENRTAWHDEPRCGNCHGSQYSENTATLYRLSTGHGGLYCESCHNSTHAILPSREAKDNQQSIALQGYPGTIASCTVCHLTQPSSGGPHH